MKKMPNCWTETLCTETSGVWAQHGVVMRLGSSSSHEL